MDNQKSKKVKKSEKKEKDQKPKTARGHFKTTFGKLKINENIKPKGEYRED